MARQARLLLACFMRSNSDALTIALPGVTQLLVYFQRFADEFNLRRHIRFQTRVVTAKLMATSGQAQLDAQQQIANGNLCSEQSCRSQPTWEITTGSAHMDHNSAQVCNHSSLLIELVAAQNSCI